MDKYGVVGNPIAHSKSPIIHQKFAQANNQQITYEKILAPLDKFKETIQQLRQQGFKGCNVTLPFKYQAFELADERGKSTLYAQSANTLIFKEDKIYAENTDGVGLIKDIQVNLRLSLAQKDILLLGAGGAGTAVLFELIQANPKSITLANRTEEKASTIIKRHQAIAGSTTLTSCNFSELQGKCFDIVINATSTGLSNQTLPLYPENFHSNTVAYEMTYQPSTTFMELAQRWGESTISNGLGMLVEQAGESFFLWRGIKPDTQSVLHFLRKQDQA